MTAPGAEPRTDSRPLWRRAGAVVLGGIGSVLSLTGAVATIPMDLGPERSWPAVDLRPQRTTLRWRERLHHTERR